MYYDASVVSGVILWRVKLVIAFGTTASYRSEVNVRGHWAIFRMSIMITFAAATATAAPA